MSYLIKVYHGFRKGSVALLDFLNDISKTLENHPMTFGLHYAKGELFYSYHAKPKTYAAFESQFYSHFNDFQIVPDDKGAWYFDKGKSVLGEMKLVNDWFFPFKLDDQDQGDFVYNLFRGFENFDVINDRVGVFVELQPIVNESTLFYIKSKLQYRFFKRKLTAQFYKYLFNHKIQNNWKDIGHKYFQDKLQENLFQVRTYIIVQAENKSIAEGKLRGLFNNFQVFKNYPLNQFEIKIHKEMPSIKDLRNFQSTIPSYILSSKEISSFFHFPRNPQNESSLLTVKSRKLALPVGIPSFDYSVNDKNEIVAQGYPKDINIIGSSDYRSIRVPIGIYDEDRLRHMYVVGKTGTGKSKFLLSLMINDIQQGKGIGVIDPHGDLIEELMMHIPDYRKEDVIIFDPTDEKFPFCLNPLDVQENGHFAYRLKNGRNVFNVGGFEGNEDLYDCFDGGGPTSADMYGINGFAISSEHCAISCHIPNCNNVYYSYYTESCSYCLGCVGIKNKQFCIFNKQYNKEERFTLANQIFAQMEKEGMLGEFFPASMCPFYFNDTIAQVVGNFNEAEIKQDGYLRRQEEVKVDIPATAAIIKTTDPLLASYDPSILEKVIQDNKGNYYRIIKAELDFHQRYALPLSQLHWMDRLKLHFVGLGI